MDRAKQWYEEAEKTVDVFSRPTIVPQGQDGTGHFSYYDYDRALSFVWDGDYKQPINVSQGGAGEPVKWLFYFSDLWAIKGERNCPPIPSVAPNPMKAAAVAFKAVCDDWITRFEVAWDQHDLGM